MIVVVFEAVSDDDEDYNASIKSDLESTELGTYGQKLGICSMPSRRKRGT